VSIIEFVLQTQARPLSIGIMSEEDARFRRDPLRLSTQDFAFFAADSRPVFGIRPIHGFPSRPRQNGFMKGIFGRFRIECLARGPLSTWIAVRVEIEDFRQHQHPAATAQSTLPSPGRLRGPPHATRGRGGVIRRAIRDGATHYRNAHPAPSKRARSPARKRQIGLPPRVPEYLGR
jgi:hypothetical protein